MDITVENITPKKATDWLNRNKANRSMRSGVAEKYADDMVNGRWTQCPVPIAFYEDGDLADGQHRLYAIVVSETTQRFPVARGLKREDGLNIDTGLGRSLVDNAKISGADKSLSAALVGCARAIAYGVNSTQGKQSFASKLETVEAHREAASWAVANTKHVRYLCNAVVMGAIGRAWYVEKDHDKLKRFCDVLGNGISEGMHESAAIAIRNYLLTKGPVASSSSMWRDTFLKVQHCIKTFMAGRHLTVVRPVTDEPYPLKKRAATVAQLRKAA